MTRSPRRSTAALLLCATALALGGCAAPGGLAPGDAAPPVSAQPRPQALWPAWSEESPKAPGAATGTRQPSPAPLRDGPAVGPGGLTAVDALDVVRADRRMRQFLGKGRIHAPGGAGVRPAAYLDVTGDGKKELVVAADTETGRTALSVYRADGERIVPVLFTLGRRMAVESLGADLLVRTAADDGSEQAVRFRWDGERMTVVSDERRWNKALPSPAPEPSGQASAADVRTGR
ncbi:hypothetical protein OOK31_30095 [Streptomyces sp. NBC_00249]|uniref:hypothetical protein n=1 Tax=Streptomyces sp. NBC_00249 TaxID=2975690 RepID=UPI0022580D28|nr:hypothetical protein [Streptomyces sp. NBC_00249]MCX5198094.1 hypothetical protein [Streptomyces sp. NBC_00249]